MTNTLIVGDKAPDFTLWEAPGKSITLSEELEKGPAVLAFYPGDFTGGCTKELCTFRDLMTGFNEMNTQVFGISVDGIFSHAAFKKANDLQFSLLSDWEKTTIRDYGIVLPDLAGMKEVAKRSVFVVDQGGKVVYAWVSDDPGIMPPFDEITKFVKDLT
ncbi:MAG: redoxin domain-containing protein [Candidatus Thorarchaeota archaeon]|nr:redoxin domain-containing protein [Candidatus Thorarchaeota archaeon]